MGVVGRRQRQLERGEGGKGERRRKGEAARLCLAVATNALLLCPDRAPRVVRLEKSTGSSRLLLCPPLSNSPAVGTAVAALGLPCLSELLASCPHLKVPPGVPAPNSSFD